jgi:hypothetical protein
LILDAVSVGVPTVVVTETVSPSLERRLEELGVDWVRKDSNTAAVFSAVDRALSRRKGAPNSVKEEGASVLSTRRTIESPSSAPSRPLFEPAW